MKKLILNSVFAGCVWLLCSINHFAVAGLIDTNSTLLNQVNATQLEQWLGQGDLDWQSIWYGETGATAASWHAAVDDIGPTVSIYDVTYEGHNYLIGGYTSLNWGEGSYKRGRGESFIFNFDNMKKWNISAGEVEIVSLAKYFATFGVGIDLWGGKTILDVGSSFKGYYQYASDADVLLGEPGRGGYFNINALETFTFSPATQVPEPPTVVVFFLGVIGLASIRFIKTSLDK